MPVTMPDAPTEATEGAPELHVPPETEFDNKVVVPGHITGMPEIVPAEGGATTLIVTLTVLVPHALVFEYLIVSIPLDRPVTTPPLVMLAIVGNELIHVPPVAVSVYVAELPMHTVAGPAIGLNTGTRLINLTPAVVSLLLLAMHVTMQR